MDTVVFGNWPTAHRLWSARSTAPAGHRDKPGAPGGRHLADRRGRLLRLRAGPRTGVRAGHARDRRQLRPGESDSRPLHDVLAELDQEEDRGRVPEVQLTRNAERDLRRGGQGPPRGRIATTLAALGAEVANLDIKALAGARPWRRLRVGDYRIRCWQRPDGTYEVGRIVHRRDLDATAAALSSAGNEPT